MDSAIPTQGAVYYAPIAAPAPTPVEIRQRLLSKLLGSHTLRLIQLNPNRNWDLIGTALILTLAAVLRFWQLGHPASLMFDETYYVKDALTLGRLGFEAQWPENADLAFEAGDPYGYLPEAGFVVHPQVAKWLIALGMMIGGGATNPVAWRLANAIFGVLAVWLIIRIARRLFASAAIGLIAGLLMAVDGGAIVHSRTALLDQFLMVFVLAAFGALLLDREISRRQLADQLAFGTALRFRWWRLVAGVLLGLACGVKWSGVYFLAVFGLLTVWWDLLARHRLNQILRSETGPDVRFPDVPNLGGIGRTISRLTSAPANPRLSKNLFTCGFWRGALIAFLTLVPTALLTYVLSWFSWFATPGAWGRDWAVQNPGQGATWLPPLLRSFMQYHRQMWQFHTGLIAEHPYTANPFGWLIQWRPTAFYWQQGGEIADFPGCDGIENCVMTVTSLANPLIWWLAMVALLVIICCLFTAVINYVSARICNNPGLLDNQFNCESRSSRLHIGNHARSAQKHIPDWRALAAISGIIAGWTPWLMHTDRTIFTFYTIAFTPWIILTLCYLLNMLLKRGRLGQGIVAVLVLAILAVSMMFYPIWTAQPIEFARWQSLMWLPTWI